MEAVQTIGFVESMTTDELRWYKIERFLKEPTRLPVRDVQQMFQVSPATANWILCKFAERGKLKKIRVGKYWGYIHIK